MSAVGPLSTSLSYIQTLLNSVLPNPPIPIVETYRELSTDEDNITKLITIMGENGYPKLIAWYQVDLIKIGQALTPIHPLKFLSVILSNPVLRQHVQSFRETFKWTIFCSRLNHNLSFLHQHGQVMKFLNDFADEFSIDPEILKNYTENEQWEAMFCFLLDWALAN